MLKILNTREGFSRRDDRQPIAWFEPLRIKGHQLEFHLLDYYDESGWYKDITVPTSQKLSELDLGDITL